MLPSSQHFGGRRAYWSSRMGIKTSDKWSIIHMDLHKPNNKLVSPQLEHFWCTNKPWANTNSQDSSQPGLGGSHHLPSYSIFYAQPRGHRPNVILSQDSQVGSLETLEIRTLATLETHNVLYRPPIEVRCKTKLYLSSRFFQQYVACHLHAIKSRQFPIFSGQKSNCQFDSQPFFWP